MAYLKLQGIEKYFASHRAIKGIDLTIEQGEFVAVPFTVGRMCQHRQRRLERVGQVARLGPGPRQHLGVAVQHAVEIVDQRLHLGGKAALQAGSTAFLDLAQCTLHGAQRQAVALRQRGRVCRA